VGLRLKKNSGEKKSPVFREEILAVEFFFGTT
jgi:hypothetical protein